MSEPLDFERMLRQPPDFEYLATKVYDVSTLQTLADVLRQVWNARGAADRAALGVELRRAMAEGGGQIRPEEILKSLDCEP